MNRHSLFFVKNELANRTTPCGRDLLSVPYVNSTSNFPGWARMSSSCYAMPARLLDVNQLAGWHLLPTSWSLQTTSMTPGFRYRGL